MRQRLFWQRVWSPFLSPACDRGTSPVGPQPAALPTSPSPGGAQPFTVSGTVTEYRGGPLPDVRVRARPNFPPGNGEKITTTDAQGNYRLSGLMEAVIVDASKDGYENTGYGAFTGDRVLNFIMNRRLEMAAGETLNATIWGDDKSFLEDDTGAYCHSRPRAANIYV